MRTSKLNRRMAIKRTPEFNKDHEEYKKLKSYDQRIQREIEIEEKWGFSLDKIMKADEVAKKRIDALSIHPVIAISDKPYKIAFKNEVPIRIEGEALYLKVDLIGNTESRLADDFMEIIKKYLSLLPKDVSSDDKKKRNRKTDIQGGVFPIYDKYIELNGDLIKTTKQLFNLEGRPASLPGPNQFDEKYLKQVKTAIKNAKAMINTERERLLSNKSRTS
jgi:hypothetical protein